MTAGSIASLSVATEESGPVDFLSLDFTKNSQRANFSFRKDNTAVFEGSYEMEVGARVEPVKIEETGFMEAANGDIFDVTLALTPRKTKEGDFRV